jgi:hypothetical protein
MTEREASIRRPLPPEAFARLGEGALAYVREFESGEFGRCYPGAPAMPAGLRIWALIGAAGSPILVSDDRNAILSGALKQSLIPVSLH